MLKQHNFCVGLVLIGEKITDDDLLLCVIEGSRELLIFHSIGDR